MQIKSLLGERERAAEIARKRLDQDEHELARVKATEGKLA